ncbi:MAG: hypothetical protein J6I49_07675 [Bacteroidales bacterium]|nr:hypothetical protein [Bacteroidales bacterium]
MKQYKYKKALVIAAAPLLFFAGCEKDEQETPTQQTSTTITFIGRNYSKQLHDTTIAPLCKKYDIVYAEAIYDGWDNFGINDIRVMARTVVDQFDKYNQLKAKCGFEFVDTVGAGLMCKKLENLGYTIKLSQDIAK